MPSRSNPNVPTSMKAKSVGSIKAKRQKTQRHAHNKANKTTTPRTSQAIRKAASISNKKARKLETKKLHARNRALEEAIQAGEVEMRDVDSRSRKTKMKEDVGEAVEATGEGMEEVMVEEINTLQ